MDYLYTIMNLDTEHLDEICEDIKNQYINGIATCALFKMTLVPEGNPPADKADLMCRKYDLFREKLSAIGVPNGVLVQASIGHGWILGEMFPYQRYTGLTDGKEENVVCPYDEGFRQYIYKAMRTIAAHNPDHIMVDDDFRLLGRGGGGCACPLHMKKFNELAGTDLTQKELIAAIGENEEYSKIFLETQKESLVETAKIMRAGIDSVNPKLQGSFCCVGNNAEFADEISAILAGAGNPVILRINNGNYTPAGARFTSRAFFRAAAQIAKMRSKTDVILAETDTCPQNRYSTGAMSLHTHFTGSILEGAAGAKHWITRLSAYEPQSGLAYRKILQKYSGFYDYLQKITPDLKWRGCRIPVLAKPVFKVGKPWNMGEDRYSGWGECVLERLGLPMYFSADNGGVLCLEGEVSLSDSEIYDALKGSVFLASDSAEYLIKRGFGQYLGVDVRTWSGKQPMLEKTNNKFMKSQKSSKELVITDEEAKPDSIVYNTVDSENYEPLFPGSVIYKNSLGGTVITFSGTPETDYNIGEVFSFLNYTRKEQLIRMLKETGELPAYYPGDEEVYFRAADMPDGGLFCAMFNIGLDPIEQIEMVFNREISGIKILTPKGTQNPVAFKQEGNRYILDLSCVTLEPVILFAYE